MADANNAPDARAEEIAALKEQMEVMRRRLEELAAEPSANEPDEMTEVFAAQEPAAPAAEPAPQVPSDQPFQQQVPGSQGGVGFDPYAYGYHVPDSYSMGAYGAPVVRAKDHVAAGLLGVFLGMFGVHKFYLGYNTPGFIMLGVTVLGGLFTFGLATSVVWLIGLVEGIIYLVKNQQDFERVYIYGKKYWF